MSIIFDVLTKSTVITFREKIKLLGPFIDRTAAITASEEYCRSKGWIG
jgi:hypothetical protein